MANACTHTLFQGRKLLQMSGLKIEMKRGLEALKHDFVPANIKE